MSKKKLTPDEWAERYAAAWKALCEGRAAVMPIEEPRRQRHLGIVIDREQTIGRKLVFRLDR